MPVALKFITTITDQATISLDKIRLQGRLERRTKKMYTKPDYLRKM
jgi:hypothetical protein